MIAIISLGVIGFCIVVFGVFLFAMRLGIGMLVAAPGVAIVVFAISWFTRDQTVLAGLIAAAVIAVLGIIIELAMDDGPFGLSRESFRRSGRR
jgi:hypothetical protein